VKLGINNFAIRWREGGPDSPSEPRIGVNYIRSNHCLIIPSVITLTFVPEPGNPNPQPVLIHLESLFSTLDFSASLCLFDPSTGGTHSPVPQLLNSRPAAPSYEWYMGSWSRSQDLGFSPRDPIGAEVGSHHCMMQELRPGETRKVEWPFRLYQGRAPQFAHKHLVEGREYVLRPRNRDTARSGDGEGAELQVPRWTFGTLPHLQGLDEVEAGGDGGRGEAENTVEEGVAETEADVKAGPFNLPPLKLEMDEIRFTARPWVVVDGGRRHRE
jgi:hypothetical protein